jgi:RNA polymerase sigma factor (sigma-70 family)
VRTGLRVVPSCSDAELIERSWLEPEVFGEVFERHFDAVFGYFARRVARTDASDLSSETFRLAFGARARFDIAHASARPWLFGFAVNVLRNDARGRRRENAAVHRLGATDTTARDDRHGALDDAIDAAGRWPEVVAALGQLRDDEREALLLLAWEDLSYSEIATVMDVPVGTVRSRIHRARGRLRELMHEDEREEAPRG